MIHPTLWDHVRYYILNNYPRLLISLVVTILILLGVLAYCHSKKYYKHD